MIGDAMTRNMMNRLATHKTAWALGCAFTVYLVGYFILRLLGYFDLATLPWTSHDHNALDILYWPFEWLRHA
jgi:hypothetical protein